MNQGAGIKTGAAVQADSRQWAITPKDERICLTLFHPDCYRRLRPFTGSADPLPMERRSRAPRCNPGYRRWGISPRP